MSELGSVRDSSPLLSSSVVSDSELLRMLPRILYALKLSVMSGPPTWVEVAGGSSFVLEVEVIIALLAGDGCPVASCGSLAGPAALDERLRTAGLVGPRVLAAGASMLG